MLGYRSTDLAGDAPWIARPDRPMGLEDPLCRSGMSIITRQAPSDAVLSGSGHSLY